MGKAALILVTAVSIASAAAYLGQDRTELEGAVNEALYEHQVLAREVAQSGFNRLESRVRRDFSGHRVNMNQVDHPRGTLDLLASGGTGEPVTISATGYYEDAQYTISGTLTKEGTRVLDALTVDGALGSVGFEGDALVSGLDTNPDGSTGQNADVHAILATQNEAYLELVAELVVGDAPGVAGLLDIQDDSPEISLSQLGDNILAYAGAGRQDYEGATEFENDTFGSAESPVVVVVDGDLTLSGSTQGFGILYVGGALLAQDSATWEGLVMVENNGGDHLFRDNARIYGAVVIRSVYSEEAIDSDDGGLPGGHFDVDVFDEFGAGDYRYHQHKYDDEYDVTGVDLLDPTGCGGGGLCWDSILGDEDAVYVAFKNADMGYGTYTIQADEGAVTEECDDGGGGWGDDDDDDGGWGDDDDDDGGWGDDDDDDGGWGDDDDDDGGWGDDDDDLLAGGMPRDVRAAGFTNLSWVDALGNRILTLFRDMGGKVYVCHVPPGNPSNAHTIHINWNAVPAHLAHGDSIGSCSSDDDDDGSDDDDDGGSDDDDDGGSDDDDDGGSDDDDDGGEGDGDPCDDTEVGIPSVDLAGNTHEGLSPTLMDAREAMTFQVNFEYLCALQISSPNGVIYDPTNRNDAFTIQVYDAELTDGSWSQGDLLYETSVYHHTGYGWDSNPGGEICDPTQGGDEVLAGDPVDLDMEDSARIQYSSLALYRARNLMAEINPGQGSITLGNVQEQAARPQGMDH